MKVKKNKTPKDNKHLVQRIEVTQLNPTPFTLNKEGFLAPSKKDPFLNSSTQDPRISKDNPHKLPALSNQDRYLNLCFPDQHLHSNTHLWT
jgi:hypothetical protein